IVVVDGLAGVDAGLLVLRDPIEEERLLIGTAADDDLLARDVGGLLDLLDVAVGPYLEAHDGVAIGGEVEEILALLGDADVRECEIILAGLDAQRPVGPGHVLGRVLETEALGDERPEIGIAADDRAIVVSREERGRWRARTAERDGELTGLDRLEAALLEGGDGV